MEVHVEDTCRSIFQYGVMACVVVAGSGLQILLLTCESGQLGLYLILASGTCLHTEMHFLFVMRNATT